MIRIRNNSQDSLYFSLQNPDTPVILIPCRDLVIPDERISQEVKNYIQSGHLQIEAEYDPELPESRPMTTNKLGDIKLRKDYRRENSINNALRRTDRVQLTQQTVNKYNNAVANVVALDQTSPLGINCASSILCIKNEMDLGCILDRLKAEGVLNNFVFTPSFYYDGRATPAVDIAELGEICQKKGAHHVIVPVTDLSGSREVIETRIRNYILQHMSGISRWNMVVDADELWVPGTGKRVSYVIKNNQNKLSINSGLIPIAGNPGYMIGENTDRLLIAIRQDERFKVIRSVNRPELSVPIDDKLAYHFTATRKTPQDVLTKMHWSGHYGDGSYDFDGWVRDIYPNLKPGFDTEKGVHMYRNARVWSNVKAFDPQQLMDIPDSLAQYLGGYEIKPRWKPTKISLLCPSRWRPDKCINNVVDNWLMRAKNLKNIEVIVSVDSDDETYSQYQKNLIKITNLTPCNIIQGPNSSMCDAINAAAKVATGDILISVFDDFEAPQGWDESVLNRLTDQPGKVLFIHDKMYDVHHGLQTMSIITRGAYEDWGYFFYPEYHGIGSDNDYTEKSLYEKRVVYALDLCFPHNHFTIKKSASDRTYEHGNKSENYTIFNSIIGRRRADNFQK